MRTAATTGPGSSGQAGWEFSVGEVLLRASRNWPDREALVIGRERLSYSELYHAAISLAARLVRKGASAETHVALMSCNSVEWVVCYFAIAMTGAVMVPVNPRFTPREIRYVLRKARCSLLLAQEGLSGLIDSPGTDDDEMPLLPLGVIEFSAGQDRFSALRPAQPGLHLPHVSPDSTAVIMFTSGSTAFPRGCMLTHVGMVRNAVLHDRRLHLSMEDRWFGPTPFFHASGCIWGILSTATVGATLVSCERFDAQTAMEILEHEKCTYQHGIDTMFVRQLEVAKRRRFDLRLLKKGTTTGSFDLIARIRQELGIEFLMSKWGATEGHGNLSLCDLDDPLEKRLGTHGRFYEEFEYRICDPEQASVPAAPGMIGEIQVRGAAMQGYFDDAEGTRVVLLPDGWLRTGDLGRIDGDYLHYTGRLKDMIKVGGENVAAQEIEAVLISHPNVLNAAVIGAPHCEWGEVAIAFVELVGSASGTEPELVDHCRSRLASVKVPKQIVFVDELPRTGSGKVDKQKLRAS